MAFLAYRKIMPFIWPFIRLKMKLRFCFFIASIGFLTFSCGPRNEKKTSEKPAKNVEVPKFNSDSAYAFVARQVMFGPRVPNTPPHQKTADYLQDRFRKYGAIVRVQEFEATTFDKNRLKLQNIIASFNPGKQKRILLASHWDTRPFADKDSVHRDAAFDGANDGASGVGILLEMSRNLGMKPPDAGVDIILFDGEDWGQKDYSDDRIPVPPDLKEWWCLGSQYWSKNKHQPNYSAYYGILLDMVGAKGSKFFREGNSLEYAPKIVEKVWNTAEHLGYSGYFVKQNAGAITDDHRFVNEVAHIPMIDIVHYQPGIGYFGDYHHSQKDNMDLISKETLEIVGNVLMNVVYSED
jgi:glutaminyl-peptide cyclotransferase